MPVYRVATEREQPIHYPQWEIDIQCLKQTKVSINIRECNSK